MDFKERQKIKMKFSGTITLQYDTLFSPFRADEYEKALSWLADSGFDGAEVCISSYDKLDVQKIKADLNKRNLECSTISTGQARTLEDISLLHTGVNLQKAQLRMKEHIDAAAVLGSKVTLGLLRGLGKTGEEANDRLQLARNLETVIDYAEQKQVTIILEAINRYETALFNSAEDTISFILHELGNPKYVGVLWDIFHANMEDNQFSEAIDCLGNKLKHVHMADSNRAFPGYGHIDLFEIGRLLVKSGYNQYMSFECLNKPSVDAVRNEAKALVEKLRKTAAG